MKKENAVSETVETTSVEAIVNGLTPEQRVKALKELGLRNQGRSISPNSARQQRIAAQNAKAAANGGVIKRGRPKMDPSLLKHPKKELKYGKRGRPADPTSKAFQAKQAKAAVQEAKLIEYLKSNPTKAKEVLELV